MVGLIRLSFYKLIPRLTDPAAFGGRADDAFDVVVPSLPGCAFFEKPRKHGSIFRVNGLWATLMKDELAFSDSARTAIGAVPRPYIVAADMLTA